MSSYIVIRDFDLFLALLVVTFKDFFEFKFIESGQVDQNLNEISNFFFWQMSKLYWKKLVYVFKMTGTHISKL